MTNPAYEIVGNKRDSRWLIACDHATNHVPDDICGGDLGLSSSEMNRHIAYDIGAAGVSRHLADLLDAPAILSCFSRLVIDPNRGADDPTLMMRVYDGTIIPGNRNADAVEIERRRVTYHEPYHAAYAELAAGRDDTIIVAVHSFTPKLNSRAPRPWHIGILYADWDTRLSEPLLAALGREPGLCVAGNEPYAGHLPGDAVDRHALQPGRPNALIEIRQDLIADEAGQKKWAELLSRALQEALAVSGI